MISANGKGVVVRKPLYLLIGAALVCAASAVYAGDQTSVDRQLKENKSYIEFLDVCVTNFGDKQKDKFFDIYEMHFNADVSFLQSDYRRAFANIYKSQGKQAALLTELLTSVYLEDSKMILDRIAPGVIKSKNAAARLYLTLAYRDRAMSRSMQIMGEAAHPRLFSAKINRYIESIKLARRAMRFGYLALFESRDIETKKYIYNHLLEIEREKGTLFYGRFLSKTGEGFIQELNRTFDDYEQEYQKNLADASHQQPAAQPQGASAQGSPSGAAAPAALPAKEPVFEKKVEREVRFRMERRVAEYLRDAEFGKAEDIMMKYVDDFNFKMVQATIEVTAAKEKDTLALNWENLKTHHIDNAARYAKPSYLESIAGSIRVKDDIKKPEPAAQDAPAGANGAQTPASPAASQPQGGQPPAAAPAAQPK